MMDFEQRYEQWKDRRRGKITSSVLPALMQSGRGEEFGKQAIREMMFVKYERRTGTVRENVSARSMDWGSNHEAAALQWLKDQFLNEIKSCADDFEHIVFNEPFYGFGDSPDFYLYDIGGGEIIEAVGEVKCPTDQAKIEELLDLVEITEKQEYYWQFIGHFIGVPQAKKLLFVIYDGYVNDGKIIEMHRKDHEKNIDRAITRIMRANRIIDERLIQTKSTQKWQIQ